MIENIDHNRMYSVFSLKLVKYLSSNGINWVHCARSNKDSRFTTFFYEPTEELVKLINKYTSNYRKGINVLNKNNING